MQLKGSLDLLAVQSDADKLVHWSDEQLLQLNPTKCKYMIISKKHKLNSNDGVIMLSLEGPSNS